MVLMVILIKLNLINFDLSSDFLFGLTDAPVAFCLYYYNTFSFSKF